MALIATILVAGGVADRTGRPSLQGQPAVLAANEASAESALSSSWFCAAGTAAPGGQADGSVVIANTATTERRGTFTVFPSAGAAVTIPITVPPRSRLDLRYAAVLTAPWAAGLVELDGGGVAAEQVVEGPLGRDVAPCANTTGERWHFASGSTAKDSSMVLAFMNPYPDAAIVDLRFATDDGPKVPGDFQGLVVPPRSVLVQEIGDHVRRRDAVSASVSVRAGRVVAARIQRFASAARSGLGLTLGARATSGVWYFPEGYFADGITERFELYNPNTREAVVELSLAIEGASAEPFELTVPAQGRITLVASQQDRIPKGKAHAATVRSVNGVNVVVDETFDAVAPSPRRGFAASTGATRPATRWVLAAGAATETSDEWVAVQNVGARAGRISIYALARGQRIAIEGLQDIRLLAGARRAFRISDHLRRDGLTLLIESDSPVVAARTLYQVGGPGISSTPGIALR